MTKSIFSSKIGTANSIVAWANSTFSLAFANKSAWVSSSNSVEIPPGVEEVGWIGRPPVADTISKPFLLILIACKATSGISWIIWKTFLVFLVPSGMTKSGAAKK